ncbi:DUF2752 domain-containing protein [Segetibacter sp. SYSU D00508]|uniref:DUF2752 domain-containing protein n=1 Tax=Aridibaculum aurantiacum TaxID=2810307 RepID=UPI001A96B6F0
MFYYLLILDWLEKHLLQCPTKALLNIDCPGCGIQRSFLLLVKGNIVESILMYPALIPILFLLIYTILHLRYKFEKGARNIKIFHIVTASIIVCFYIYKIVNHKLIA